MAIDERSRHVLHAKLEHVLGPDEAATLMEHLPPVGWADVATKRDLDVYQAAMKRDLDGHHSATRRDIDALQTATKREIESYKTATRREIEQLGTQLRTEMQVMEERIRADTRSQIISAERHFVTWLLGSNATIAALAFAAAKLL